MKKTIPLWIGALCAVAAICGIAFGIAANGRKNAAEQDAARLRKQLAAQAGKAVPTVSMEKTKDPDTNDTALLAAQLAERDAELEHLRKQLEENQPKPRESWSERMARMKEEDPEAYAEIIQRRSERQQTLRYDLAERTATFVDADTSFMTEEERANHELLLEKMSNIWKLTDQFQDPEQPPNRESMRELFGAINEARPLLDAERSAMFRQLANDSGYEGEEAAAFAGYAEEIVRATTIQPPRRPGMGGGRIDAAK